MTFADALTDAVMEALFSASTATSPLAVTLPRNRVAVAAPRTTLTPRVPLSPRDLPPLNVLPVGVGVPALLPVLFAFESASTSLVVSAVIVAVSSARMRTVPPVTWMVASWTRALAPPKT